MTAPIAVFSTALRRAARGAAAPFEVLDSTGQRIGRVDASAWAGDLLPGDDSLLRRCVAPVLDVGCGSGRLTAALARCGESSLGVDVSPEAVRQARRRGAGAVRASVFDALPDEGRWRSVLLADGNIGIGGDPVRLLERCARLLQPDGIILAEVRPPGESGWRADIILRHGSLESTAFPWASVAVDEVGPWALRAALYVRHMWTDSGRWFVELAPR